MLKKDPPFSRKSPCKEVSSMEGITIKWENILVGIEIILENTIAITKNTMKGSK